MKSLKESKRKGQKHRHHSSSSDGDNEEKLDHNESILFQYKVKLIHSYIGQVQPAPKQKLSVASFPQQASEKKVQYRLPACLLFSNGLKQMLAQITGYEEIVPIKPSALPNLPIMKRQVFYSPANPLWSAKDQVVNPDLHLLTRGKEVKDLNVSLTQKEARTLEKQFRQVLNILSATDCLTSALKKCVGQQGNLIKKMVEAYIASNIQDPGVKALLDTNMHLD